MICAFSVFRDMIRVLVRHCNVSNHKRRPEWFCKEQIFLNLLQTVDESCELHVMFDGDPTGHFTVKHPISVVRFAAGCDAGAFNKTLQFAECHRHQWDPTDIVYFVEDDYLHKPGWPMILREAFQHSLADIVSLYDHTDKYKPDTGLCKLAHTDSCHWRSAVSTTNTFALKFSTLLEDLPIYYKYAAPERSKVCVDHEKFVELCRTGRRLFTSIPAYATHCESDYISPVVSWP